MRKRLLSFRRPCLSYFSLWWGKNSWQGNSGNRWQEQEAEKSCPNHTEETESQLEMEQSPKTLKAPATPTQWHPSSSKNVGAKSSRTSQSSTTMQGPSFQTHEPIGCISEIAYYSPPSVPLVRGHGRVTFYNRMAAKYKRKRKGVRSKGPTVFLKWTYDLLVGPTH